MTCCRFESQTTALAPGLLVSGDELTAEDEFRCSLHSACETNDHFNYLLTEGTRLLKRFYLYFVSF